MKSIRQVKKREFVARSERSE